MVFWAYLDLNENCIGLQIDEGIITVCGTEENETPPRRVEITAELYRRIMTGW